MARSFLTPEAARAVKAASPAGKPFTQEQKDRVALGMAIGQCYRAGLSRSATLLALVGLTDEEKTEAITRWEANRKAYNLSIDWAE